MDAQGDKALFKDHESSWHSNFRISQRKVMKKERKVKLYLGSQIE